MLTEKRRSSPLTDQLVERRNTKKGNLLWRAKQQGNFFQKSSCLARCRTRSVPDGGYSLNQAFPSCTVHCVGLCRFTGPAKSSKDCGMGASCMSRRHRSLANICLLRGLRMQPLPAATLDDPLQQPYAAVRLSLRRCHRGSYDELQQEPEQSRAGFGTERNPFTETEEVHSERQR